jgi:hypothetical protein
VPGLREKVCSLVKALRPERDEQRQEQQQQQRGVPEESQLGKASWWCTHSSNMLHRTSAHSLAQLHLQLLLHVTTLSRFTGVDWRIIVS